MTQPFLCQSGRKYLWNALIRDSYSWGFDATKLHLLKRMNGSVYFGPSTCVTWVNQSKDLLWYAHECTIKLKSTFLESRLAVQTGIF